MGSDVPAREDFNRDNSIIDSALHEHGGDGDIHTTAQEKQQWSNPFYVGSYIGDGSASRTVTLECPFNPRWGLLFAAGYFSSVNDYTNRSDYNYFAVFSPGGSTAGAALSGNQLSVVSSSSAMYGNEYRALNDSGVTYFYIAFR